MVHDQLFLPFLVCEESNVFELSWDTCQIELHQCHNETKKYHRTRRQASTGMFFCPNTNFLINFSEKIKNENIVLDLVFEFFLDTSLHHLFLQFLPLSISLGYEANLALANFEESMKKNMGIESSGTKAKLLIGFRRKKS